MKREKFQYLVKVFMDKTSKMLSRLVKGASALAGEALSVLEAKKVATDIQAQAYLRNAQRQALREMPILALNQVQASQLENQTFGGFGMYPGPIQLDPYQADSIMHHMMAQYSLDPDSSQELVKAVTPLVGVPNMMCSVCHAHKVLADTIIIPVINERKRENNIPCIDYQNIVESPLYYGYNQGITLQYNIHSVTDAEKIKQRYDRGGQYIEQTREILKNVGVQIDRVESKGILLRIHLKWA